MTEERCKNEVVVAVKKKKNHQEKKDSVFQKQNRLAEPLVVLMYAGNCGLDSSQSIVPEA